jgi:hypothetical protein
MRQLRGPRAGCVGEDGTPRGRSPGPRNREETQSDLLEEHLVREYGLEVEQVTQDAWGYHRSLCRYGE